MMSKFPLSPVTLEPHVRRGGSVLVADIVRLYQEQEGLDVKRFFTHGDEISILECIDTGYRFYYPFETAGDEKFYQELARNQAAKGREYDRDWSEDHATAQENILSTDSLLEIGCNTGKFLSLIKDFSQMVCGLEFNEIAAETARSKGLNVVNQSIEDYAAANPELHDVVCSFQVLEHVTTVRSFIDSSLTTLRPGGRLILSVPNSEPYFQRHNKYDVMNLPPHHVGLWNLKVFEKLAGFFQMDLVEHSYSGLATFRGDVYLRSRLIAGIKSLPRRHSFAEKLLLFAVSPLAFARSSLAFIAKRKNYAYLTVVFKKRNDQRS